jgi:hypothetical protein
MSLLRYFRYPFPSTEGFSAYRSPGMAVHGPLIVAFTVAGFFLCWPHAILRPLLMVWAVSGLYLGRDIAVLCHYSPCLTLACWGASAAVLFRPAALASFGASHFVVSAALSVVVVTAMFLVAARMTRGADSGA